MRTTLLFTASLLAASAHAQNRLPPGMRPPGCTAGLQLPTGFCATVFAQGVPGARHIVVAPNGDVFVNTDAARGGGAGGIVAFRDTNQDGKSDVQQRFGATGGTGIALHENYLYATSGNSIVRYRVATGSLTPTGKPDTIVTGLPMTGSHHSHNFVLNGRALYVNVGSASNACQQRDRQTESRGNNPCTELQTRAGIWQFDATRLRQRPADGSRFATGLRNSVALARNPFDGGLYATVHGRDQLHDNWSTRVPRRSIRCVPRVVESRAASAGRIPGRFRAVSLEPSDRILHYLRRWVQSHPGARYGRCRNPQAGWSGARP